MVVTAPNVGPAGEEPSDEEDLGDMLHQWLVRLWEIKIEIKVEVRNNERARRRLFILIAKNT